MSSDNEFEECSPIMLHNKKRCPTCDPYEKIIKEVEVGAKQLVLNRILRLDEDYSDLSLKEDFKHGYRPTKYDPDELYKICYWSNEIDDEDCYVQANQKNVIFYGVRHSNVFTLSDHIAKQLPKKAAPLFGEYERYIKCKYLSEKKKVNPERPFTGMKDGKHQHIFRSDFESGNLDSVIKKSEKEYELFMRSDTNRSNKQNWFYFSVENETAGTVKFHIMNCISNPSLYQQGMKICIKSSSDGGKWVKGGDDIQYKISRISNLDYRRKHIYSLSFNYTFKTDREVVYFAYAYPYTYSNLWEDLTRIKESQQRLEAKKRFVRFDKLCTSNLGLLVPVLTITSRVNCENYNLVWEEEKALEDKENIFINSINKVKKHIFIGARVHPSETCGSFMAKGFIDFLISDNPSAVTLRSNYIFKIVPMINPDGVVAGNFRCSISGNDLNRKYLNADMHLHPTIFHIKELFKRIINKWNDKTSEPFELAIDLHGHNKKKCAFMFAPSFPAHEANSHKIKSIPKYIAERNQCFRLHSCKFANEKEKRQSFRLAIWKMYKIPRCYTLEASLHEYYDSNRKHTEFTPEAYESLGKSICESIYDFSTDKPKQRLLKVIKEEEHPIKRAGSVKVKSRLKALENLYINDMLRKVNLLPPTTAKMMK